MDKDSQCSEFSSWILKTLWAWISSLLASNPNLILPSMSWKDLLWFPKQMSFTWKGCALTMIPTLCRWKNVVFTFSPLDRKQQMWAGGVSAAEECHLEFYLKLLPELRGVALGVNLQHLLIGESELVNGDGGLSTQTGLQDGVVDEHVLLLRDRQQQAHSFTQSRRSAAS